MLNSPLFPEFLDNLDDYRRCEELWHAEWKTMLAYLAQCDLWQTPWISSTFADGTPIRDGNPMFSAWSPGMGLSIRIIQLEPTDDTRSFSIWTSKFARDDAEELDQLVIRCVLTQKNVHSAIEAMRQWILDGEVWVEDKHSLPTFPRGRSLRQPLYELVA